VAVTLKMLAFFSIKKLSKSENNIGKLINLVKEGFYEK